MSFKRIYLSSLFLLTSCMITPVTKKVSEFKHYPYLQNPSTTAISIIWYSNTSEAGLLLFNEQNSKDTYQRISTPTIEEPIQFSDVEIQDFFNNVPPVTPYRHRIRIENLLPETTYNYRVVQGQDNFEATFTTAPISNKPLRLIVYADSETEPESTGKITWWDVPHHSDNKSDIKLDRRLYLVDQTKGYQNNLDVIKTRNPDLILIAGDLVQSGGEQRDWDEFWRHNTDNSKSSLASNVPILAAIGNHEYYGGESYDPTLQIGSKVAAKKFLNYFESPKNNASNKEQEGRYYSFKYGPVTMIMLDVNNNSPHKTDTDTSFYLLGESDEGGTNAPDFYKGSKQYLWLEQELAAAQKNSSFTFVIFHQSPYSSGPHGLPPGMLGNTDPQSGIPVRILTPLFLKYGVDAVLNGHDEMLERSTISGKEKSLTGELVDHDIQFYDVGIGGDGLRAPVSGLINSHKKFLVHEDSPELWEDHILIDGGKHYGHLEIDFILENQNTWKAVFNPVYVFPDYNTKTKTYSGYSRRVYDDHIIMLRPVKFN